ncbi:TPA: hypothetical protein MO340_004225 [Salmonella enterica subsp. salamae serovar 35:g,m,s,t:-]|nr:hypothetical protein [Salmonella enterica subsp. salamae serovar 35:g,m,s,t:-]HCA3549697.1 hypothetical protein [Salmonella enterica subsp. salamae serovar 35:g,m,s,t:-]
MNGQAEITKLQREAYRKVLAGLSMSTDANNQKALESLTGDLLGDYVPAQRTLAMLYLQMERREDAFQVFLKLSDLGDHVGQLRVALYYIESNTMLSKARELLELSVAAGSLSAKYYLGRMLIEGIGGDTDIARGQSLLDASEGKVFDGQ